MISSVLLQGETSLNSMGETNKGSLRRHNAVKWLFASPQHKGFRCFNGNKAAQVGIQYLVIMHLINSRENEHDNKQ
jgi:hypothetical protein